MSRWTDELKEHAIWTTVETMKAHLSVEFDDIGDELILEKRRLEQFIVKLLETLNALDSEQTPFNRLDDLNNQLINVANHTEAYSTTGDLQYLRNANDHLRNPLSELCILQCCTLPIAEQGQVNQLNKLVEEFISKIEQQSSVIDQTLEQQERRLNNLISQMTEKDTELNSLISGWQNQFNEAQQAKLIEHNAAHKQRDKASSDLLEETERKAEETVDKLILEKDVQLKSVLDNTENKSNEFIDAIKKEFEDTKDYCEEKREEMAYCFKSAATRC